MTDTHGHSLSNEITAFMIDRQARGLSRHTLEYYQQHLERFEAHCEGLAVYTVEGITPDVIRRAYIDLATHRSAGGIRAMHITLKAFLNWWEVEAGVDDWVNPIRKVTPPKGVYNPPPELSNPDFRKLLAACATEPNSARDRAILTVLWDTGIRKAELTGIQLPDLDLRLGEVVIQHGKGDKKRVAFLGAVAKRELLRYLRVRKGEPEGALWMGQRGPLTPDGLRQMVERRAKLAGLKRAPGLHEFRRAFARNLLRKGVSTLDIARLLGHANVYLVERYARAHSDDLKAVHERASPADDL